MPMLNIGQLAEMTGFNRETVKKRLSELTPEEGPRSSRIYDSRKALPEIFQVEKLDKTVDLTQARAQLAVRQKEKIELDMELRRGDYLDRGDVINGMISLFSAFRSKIMGIPTKAVPRLAAAKDKIEQEQMLLELVTDALKELADPDAYFADTSSAAQPTPPSAKGTRAASKSHSK